MPGGPSGPAVVVLAGPASSFSYAFAPVVAFAAVGVLVLMLRWAGGRGGSLVPPPARPGRPDEYGLLVSIAAPMTATEAEAAMDRLERAGIRATLAGTSSGPRLMVFADDESRARGLLSQPPM